MRRILLVDLAPTAQGLKKPSSGEKFEFLQKSHFLKIFFL
jgi:hypothetical protein